MERTYVGGVGPWVDISVYESSREMGEAKRAVVGDGIWVESNYGWSRRSAAGEYRSSNRVEECRRLSVGREGKECVEVDPTTLSGRSIEQVNSVSNGED